MTITPSSSKSRLASTALCGALALLASPALAQQQSIDIPAGDLQTALTAYQAATGQTVRTDGVDLRGRTTRGVQGAQSSDQALSGLLAGSRLAACAADGGVVLVEAGRGCASGVPGSTMVDEVVVTATAVSHLADRNRTGTRMDADPLTVPLSVSTVSEELIQRQQALTLADAASNVVGVQSGIEGSFQMRGFSANVMRNGTLGGDGRSTNLPIVAVSRLEVVKGPEAIIAGMTAGYGGVVNVITKTPPKTTVAEGTLTLGSYGYYDLGFDLGGPLNAEGTVLGRIVTSTANADRNAVGYDGPSSDYIAPSVTFRIPKWGTELTAQYEWQNARQAPDLVAFAPPGATKLTDDLPLVRYGPKSSGRDVENRTTTISLEQRITDNWNFAIRYTNDEQHRISDIPTTFALYALVPYPDMTSIVFNSETQTNVESFKYELRGDFNTGPISHKLLLAYDTTKTEILVGNQGTAVYTTNVETGVTTNRTADLGPLFGVPGPRFDGGARPEETGILLMDQMTWGDFVVLAGYRRMKYDFQQIGSPALEAVEEDLPSLGIVYRATPTLSFYANASKGFTANQGLYTISGAPVAPEYAQQYEVGAKALLLNDQLAATVALFQINQENVAAPDPDNPWPISICLGSSQVCYVSVEGVKSKGVEFEVSGRLLPRLEVRANYTYTEKDVDPLFQSNVYYTPHQGSLWATYSFGDNGLGWWAGGGFQARGKRSEAGRPDDLSNPGQIRVDLSAGYEADRWSAVFGVKNVMDERLYDANSGVNGSGTVVQPREVFATIRYRFQ